jgi:PKD repeat protein
MTRAGSSSVDEDGDALTFFWDFGDGVKLAGETVAHTFLKNGRYEVNLIASDGQSETVFKKVFDFSSAPAVNKITLPEPKKAKNISTASLNNKSAAMDYILAGNKDSFSPVETGNVQLLPAGTPVKVSGTVIAPPGVYGTQYFYVVNSPPGEGLGEGLPAGAQPPSDFPRGENKILENSREVRAVKIYNFKKDFPPLSEGDYLAAQGETAGGVEKYLKVSAASDIEISGGKDLPEPEEIFSLSKNDYGRFVRAAGTVEEKDGNRFTLATASDSVPVYLKPSAGIKSVKEGEELSVIGLVLYDGANLALLPRYQKDLTIQDSQDQKENLAAAPTITVSGNDSDWVLPERQSHTPIFIYFLIITTFAGVIAFFVLKKKIRD